MTLLQGPKDPVLPTLVVIVHTYFENQNFICLLYLSSKSVEQYFGLAGWQTWQTGRSVETKEVLTFNSSFLNKSLTWSFLVVSSPKWGVRSLCGKGTKYYCKPGGLCGDIGDLYCKNKWGWISTVSLCSARLAVVFGALTKQRTNTPLGAAHH
jgi:hypothetical protein